MTLDEFLTKTLGERRIGIGIPGECLGYWNLKTRQVDGVDGFPIQGASYAYQMLDVKNTRPDKYEQIKDPKLRGIKKGDAVIWGKDLGGTGHIALYMEPRTGGFLSQEQNWIPQTVTREIHNFDRVIGYIKVKGDEMTEDEKKELTQLRVDLNTWNHHRWQENVNQDKKIDANFLVLKKLIEDVNAKLDKFIETSKKHSHPEPEAKPQFNEPTRLNLQWLSDLWEKIKNWKGGEK